MFSTVYLTLVANRSEQSVSWRDSSFGEMFTNIKLKERSTGINTKLQGSER